MTAEVHVAASEEPSLPERRAGRSRGRRAARWTAAIATTCLVHGAAFFLLDVPVPEMTRDAPAPPRLAWMGSSPSSPESLLGEQLLLFDNAPLFLPTHWNAAAAENLGATGRSPAEIFGDFQTRLSVVPEKIPEVLSILPDGVETPLEGARTFKFDLLSAFGRTGREMQALPPRLALLEVREAFTGRVLGSREISLDEAPGASDWPDWDPFEVLVNADAAGWQAPPMVVRGSGSQAVDVFFRRYIRQQFRPDLEFGPGYYRILVGP
ncbi:MAG: hypothetical protein ACREIA_23715 [Opitutaceae bacterium]